MNENPFTTPLPLTKAAHPRLCLQGILLESKMTSQFQAKFQVGQKLQFLKPKGLDRRHDKSLGLIALDHLKVHG